MAVEQLAKKDFESKVMKKEGLVVIDFSAVWCGPCQMLSPIYERIAEKYSGKADFFKVDVDQEQDLSIEFKVQGVPTILFFKDGKVAERNTGLIPESRLVEIIDALL